MKNYSLKLILAMLAILVLGSWVLSGCSSDSVAPNDETPELSEENAGYQAAMVGLAMHEVGPRILDYVNKDVETYNLSGYDYVEGSVQVDYRTGGADGTPSTPGNADYAHLTTLGENGLVLTWDGIPNSAMYLTADIEGTIGTGSVTILAGSGGTMTSGVYVLNYAIDGLVFHTTGYPSGGSITVSSGPHELSVAFNGTSMAIISVGTTPTWYLDLETGNLSAYSALIP